MTNIFDHSGKTILIPLTASLYVPGTLTSVSTVLVDVGTGYYVEKSIADAQVFYKKKVDGIQQNITDLEKIITQKSQNVRIVEEGMFILVPFFSKYSDNYGQSSAKRC